MAHDARKAVFMADPQIASLPGAVISSRLLKTRTERAKFADIAVYEEFMPMAPIRILWLSIPAAT
jgi:hypothetical protein